MGAKRSLGQHFLVSERAIQAILEACGEASPAADGVLEIGPGPGALTAGLHALGKPLVLAEKDDAFAPALASKFPGATVQHGDAREVDLAELSGRMGLSRWLVVGNLPYNVGTEIARLFLAHPQRVVAVVWMLQREVVQKIVAGPGEEGYSPLAIWTQSAWKAEKLFEVPPGAFHPPPKVTSAVVRLTPLPAPLLSESAGAPFEAFLKAAFVRPRRTLASNLGISGKLEKEAVQGVLEGWGLPGDLRPAALPVTRYAELFTLRGA